MKKIRNENCEIKLIQINITIVKLKLYYFSTYLRFDMQEFCVITIMLNI